MTAVARIQRVGFDAVKEHLHAQAAEDSVLGACLFKPEILAWLDVDDRDFYDPRNQTVWKAARAVFERDGTVDVTLLVGELGRRNVLDAVGGVARLSELAILVPTVDNVAHYAAEIRRKRVSRDVYLAVGQVEGFIRDGVEGEELLAEISATLARIAVPAANRIATMPELIREEWVAIGQDLAAMQNGKVIRVGVPTGIPTIDAKTGGQPRGLVSVIAARPGKGKSTLALTFARAAVRAGEVSVIISYEDGGATYARRSLAELSGVEVTRIKTRQIFRPDLPMLQAAVTRADAEYQYLYFIRAHGLPIAQAYRLAVSLGREKPVTQILFDYMQNAAKPTKGVSKNEVIEAAMQDGQEIAAKHNIALGIVSQLGRGLERRGGDAMMSDLKDSGALEQDAKFIIAIEDALMESGDVWPGHVRLSPLKINDGPSDWSVVCRFDAERARFLEISTRSEQ